MKPARYAPITIALGSLGCAGPQTNSCYRETWAGMCEFSGSTVVKEAELPVPFSVVEVRYSPQKNAQSPNFTPPDTLQTHQVMSRDEQSFDAYLAQYKAVPCQLVYPQTATCSAGQLVLQMPAFDPSAYRVAAPEAPKGCAQIEAQGLNAPNLSNTSEPLSEQILFARDQSTLGPQNFPALDSLAARLNGDRSIECVSLVGRVSTAENLGLAELRAQEVKRALVSRGVESIRLMTVSATQPVYGTGTTRPPPDPKDQRVNLTIVARSAGAQR